mgnify:CR=1 FL=1
MGGNGGMHVWMCAAAGAAQGCCAVRAPLRPVAGSVLASSKKVRALPLKSLKAMVN